MMKMNKKLYLNLWVFLKKKFGFEIFIKEL